MTVRDTSIEAYHQIKAEGLLSARRLQVYTALFEHGPCTANELYHAMRTDRTVTTINQQANLTPRLGELRDLGVVRECGEVDCPITWRRVIQWDVTSKLPKGSMPRRVKASTVESELLREIVATVHPMFLGDLLPRIERLLVGREKSKTC